ncbi:unnamed protein product [Rhizoctonia solani]|uniref:DUF6535 domain-containing protein n=1 Tax=Rhizoctonia solani TaxID=456999 RepID=A0A8H3BD35_9AGAM|nr:unnamed protein product [Rhizoctonia solani]
MDIFLPHTRRDKHKQGRSQSLPARPDPVYRSDFRGRMKEIPRNGTEAASKLPPQAGEMAFDKQTMREEIYPQRRSLDEWSHLKPDERGAELAREARIWQVYVGETDKSDKELIEGWDKSMDVLLVFAALFSAISTTFLIETSGMLKQDPNDISAAALVVISQALVAISTGNSSANPLASTPPEQGNASDFVPSRVAVIVNTLWTGATLFLLVVPDTHGTKLTVDSASGS